MKRLTNDDIRDNEANTYHANRVVKAEKPKRIKRVFSNHEQVLHLWANQSQSDARSHNVYFEGLSCYSYGSHYELGRLIKVKGHTVAVINDRGYSNTTAKHIHSAWHAVSHMPRIKSPTLNWLRGLKDTSANLKGELEALLRRRSFWTADIRESIGPESYLGERIIEFNKTAKLLGKSSLCVKITTKYEKQLTAHIKARVERQKQLRSPEAIAARQAKALKLAASQVQAWRDHGASRLTKAVRNLRPMLIRVYGNVVQTSGGAEVPLDQAITLLRNIENNQDVINNAIGGFKVTSVNALNDGMIKIGCHTIALAEARRVLGHVKTKLELITDSLTA